jgi:hypothetical protein
MTRRASDRDEAPLFDARTLRWLWIVGGASLLICFASIFIGDDASPADSDRPGQPLGTSAVGWGALVELLDDRGVTTRTGRRVADVAEPRALTILLQPLMHPDSEETLLNAVEAADTLIVLPKWNVRRQTAAGPVTEARLRPRLDPQDVLDALSLEAEVVRPPSAAWLPKGEHVPELQHPQLLDVRGGEIVIDAVEGTLAWRTSTPDGRNLFVLSDPDLLANHGLGRRDNAHLAMALIDRPV